MLKIREDTDFTKLKARLAVNLLETLIFIFRNIILSFILRSVSTLVMYFAIA